MCVCECVFPFIFFFLILFCLHFLFVCFPKKKRKRTGVGWVGMWETMGEGKSWTDYIIWERKKKLCNMKIYERHGYRCSIKFKIHHSHSFRGILVLDGKLALLRWSVCKVKVRQRGWLSSMGEGWVQVWKLFKNSCLLSLPGVCPGPRVEGIWSGPALSQPPTLSFAYSLKDSTGEVETNSCSKLMFWVDICISAKFTALDWVLAALSNTPQRAASPAGSVGQAHPVLEHWEIWIISPSHVFG